MSRLPPWIVTVRRAWWRERSVEQIAYDQGLPVEVVKSALFVTVPA